MADKSFLQDEAIIDGIEKLNFNQIKFEANEIWFII
jgi:hypothetical protein